MRSASAIGFNSVFLGHQQDLVSGVPVNKLGLLLNALVCENEDLGGNGVKAQSTGHNPRSRIEYCLQTCQGCLGQAVQ